MVTHTRECLLYTLEGIKTAVAIDNGEQHITIKADNYSILVNRPTVARKFECDTKPTFYAC